MRPAVFLDRDDTLIRCNDIAADGDLGDSDLVELLPGVAEGCRALKDAGFALIVITNQGGVARGKYGVDAVDRVNARINELLGGVIDAFRACPYHPRGVVPEYTREHPWRKPAPGMIHDAAESLGLDLSRSWLIGDAPRDCAAGRAAGCRTILVGDRPPDDTVDHVAPDFASAASIVLSEASTREPDSPAPRRLLVVAPSWVGDVVMATPAFRALRDRLPGAFIGALVKPGIDELLAGTDYFDELHVDSRDGMMGVKRAAIKVRPRRYDAALLLTNSFSTAAIVRLAGIPRRIGYGRDGRSMLLTESLAPIRRADMLPYSRSTTNARKRAPVPACESYLRLARHLLRDDSIPLSPMRLAVTDAQIAAGDDILRAAGATEDTPFVVLNPGGNNPAKRWPAERFAALARRLESAHGVTVLVAGSPGERDLAVEIVRAAGLPPSRSLPEHGLTLGALKQILRRAALLITNDTGPRHIAAAFDTPVLALFGPTDPRWTIIPFDERIIVADPTLPEEEVVEDHPERCRVDRISLEDVQAATEELLGRAATMTIARAGEPDTGD